MEAAPPPGRRLAQRLRHFCDFSLLPAWPHHPSQAFDAGRAAPALSNLLSSGGLAAPGKRVLVPGCGRGYDVIEFVGKGASLAVGLELAPTAQQAASQHLAAQLGKEGEGQRWQVFAGDFFRWEHPSSTSFDVGYDYTFMWCA